jgi:hypothetical protein
MCPEQLQRVRAKAGSSIGSRTTTSPRWEATTLSHHILADVAMCHNVYLYQYLKWICCYCDSVQGVCVNTLISLGFSDLAFDLSVRFRYFLGIMIATLDLDPVGLRPQLHRLLSESGDMEAIVDPFPRVASLAAFCFEWLEHHGRLAEVLEEGKYAPDHLSNFLKVRLFSFHFA